MKRVAGLLLLGFMALPVWAADPPPGCAWLCGSWVLDAAHSESAAAVVDAALAKYKEPTARKPRRHQADPVAQADAEAEDALRPMYDRPLKAQMRERLLVLVTPPASLVLAEQGEEIIIRPAGGPERHAFPGEPHSRVDDEGTAKIRTEWKKDALVINESYDHRREQTETYALLPDGTLQVTRVVERPGVKKLELRSIYRRG
jgi:hypothetical protein